MYGFDDSDEPGRARLLGAAALAIVVIAALGWFILRPALTNDETAVPSASGSVFEFDSVVSSAAGSMEPIGAGDPANATLESARWVVTSRPP